MMSDPLSNYLHDHLAGAKLATTLMHELVDQYAEEPLGKFSAGLLTEVEEDQATLERLIERVGGHKPSPRGAKQVFAWLIEKSSQLKLHRRAGSALGSLEALELLSLGILGKRALWRVLAQLSATDERLTGENFPRLVERAQTQFELVEERRLDTSWEVLAPRREDPVSEPAAAG